MNFGVKETYSGESWGSISSGVSEGSTGLRGRGDSENKNDLRIR